MNIRKLLFLAGVLVMLSGVMLPIQSVGATTFPGKNGAVAFVKERRNAMGVWTLNPENGYTNRLVKQGSQPAWSPDGVQLAYVGDDNQLWLTDIAGGTSRLTKGKGDESSPVWSKDGRKIAFVRQQKSGAKLSAIMTIDVSSKKETNISGWSYVRFPSWSPDGKEIVYEQYRQDGHALFVKNVSTGQMKKLIPLSENVESRVAWSPLGNKILYSDSQNEVYTIRPDGSYRTVISDGESYDAVWSPDGRSIAFLEDPNDDHISISGEDGTIQWISFEKGAYETIGALTWSPDGTKLIFTMSYERAHKEIVGTFLLDITNEMPQPQKVMNHGMSQVSWQAQR